MSTPDPNAPQVPPVPLYGEYAPVVPPQPYPPQSAPAYVPFQSQQPQYGQPYYNTAQYGGKPPIRVADTIISVVLLIMGLLGTLFALLTALELSSAMQGSYDEYGLGTYVPTSGYVPTQAVLIASHLLLLAICTPITILLIVKRKISFWVPLAAGVLAAIVYWVALMALLFSDPLVNDYLMSQTR